METELIQMGISGPADATTEQLLAKAAQMLGLDSPKGFEVIDEVEPGNLVFHAAMPAGYYEEHEDEGGEEIVDGEYTLSWETP